MSDQETIAERIARTCSSDIDLLEDSIESLTDNVQLTGDYYGINMAQFDDGSCIDWNYKLEVATS